MNRPLTSWPIFLGRALYDVSGHIEDWERVAPADLDQFVRRWGDFDTETFQRALEGEAKDRLFALFALGYLDTSHLRTVVTPFLDSPLLSERWASTITLGRWRDENMLEALLELLQEGLVYAFSPETQPVDAEGNVPWHSKDAEQAYQLRYDWCMIQRRYAAMELASWQHPLVIPALIRAFEICYNLEMQFSFPKTPYFWLLLDWQKFQDCLAYALGQQGAWDAPDRLGLPAERLHIMRIYMIYGALHAKQSFIMNGLYYSSLEEMGIERPEQVGELLQERFHLPPEVCETYFDDFRRYCWHREGA